MCKVKKYIVILFLLQIAFQNLSAQSCVEDYFNISYQGEKQQFVTKTKYTPENELLSIGYIDCYIPGHTYRDGWITKYSAQGNVLWSKRYKSLNHNHFILKDIVRLPDGSYLVVGDAFFFVDSTHSTTMQGGILLKIDKYGNLVWSKSFHDVGLQPNDVFYTSIDNIVPLKNGDFLLGIVFNEISPLGKSMLLLIDDQGNVKWKTQISSNNLEFDFDTYKAITQLSDDNIVIGSYVIDVTTVPGKFSKVGFYLVCLDYNTGDKLWDNSYLFVNSPTTTPPSEAPIQQITELPDGNLSLMASVSDTSGFHFEPYTQRSVNIITDSKGSIIKAIGYYNTVAGCRTVDVLKLPGGKQIVLMHDGNKPLLIQIDEYGQVLRQKAYGNTKNVIRPISFTKGSSGYYILSDGRAAAYGSTYLIKVDSLFKDSCIESSVNIISEDAIKLFKTQNSNMKVESRLRDNLINHSCYSSNYSLGVDIECMKACCKDVMDTVVKTTLCEGSTYTLPDGYAVKDSGTYYTSYKTSKGCDSVAFYHISFIKNPASLKISGDECIEGKDTITLKATSGFEKYNWLNDITTDSTHLITKPGIYWVSVSNSCGAKRDSIKIFDKCEFPIYIPTAFTPNGDGLNDLFRIPPSNKNKLIRLLIYNRWGQKVFETKNVNEAWDGTFKGKQQSVGVFVYFLIMENLKGNKTAKRGAVTLIR